MDITDFRNIADVPCQSDNCKECEWCIDSDEFDARFNTKCIPILISWMNEVIDND